MPASFAAILMSILTVQTPPAPAEPGCEVDYGAMMALRIDAFDQDMNGGWRPLARRPECRDEAAELIRVYREFVEPRIRLLYWHEGQIRAGLGQHDAAIALFEKSRRDDEDEYGWNHYVDATIAFLRGDRISLESARARLASSRIPDRGPDWRGFAGPMNLDVVDGFIRCFGRPYEEAYGTPACRQPESRR